MTRLTPRASIALVLAAAMLASAPAAAAYGTATDGGAPADVAVGDDTQTISGVAVTVDSAGQDGVDVYYNVTALETAGVGLDSLGVDVGEVDGAEQVDQNVNRNNGYTTVRVTFDVNEGTESFTVSEITLTGLDTSGAEPTENLDYEVAVDSEERTGTDAPGASDASTDAFAVVETTDDGSATGTTDDVDETDAPDDGDDGDDEAGGDDGTDAGSTGDSAPGFGAVVALVALVAAALVAVRR